MTMPHGYVFLLLASVFAADLFRPPAAQGDDDLIPRSVLFGNPEKASPRISPDGKIIAFRAPRDGVMNVWVAPVDDIQQARPVTDDRTTGIQQFFWAFTSHHILYLQDDNGDEDFHLFRVDLDSNEAVDLTPFEKISARVQGISPNHPEHLLVGINDRGLHYFHDLHRINLVTGERELVEKNNGFLGYLSDHDYNVKLAFRFSPAAGELEVLKPDPQASNGWSTFDVVGPEDVLTTNPVGIDKSGNKMYLLDSRGRDTAALKIVDLNNGEQELVFAADQADVDGIVTHPSEHTIQAVTYTHARAEWEILDPQVKVDVQQLKSLSDGDLEIVSRTLDDRTWIVAFELDDGPVKFYLYDRDNKHAKFLFSHRPELEQVQLAKMHPVVIPARDGLELVSYLTLPPSSDPQATGRPDQPLPLVLLVHGGPWARDFWGYNPVHQMLANRGYAVLSVNYRGSTGFGKQFINAANLQWARKMHDDLIDAVQWAVDNRIAIEDRMAIMGGSYGGYATLVGLTFTPETFACGVDIVGPSSLISLLNNPPPYWMPMMPLMKARVGDWQTDDGKELLRSRSPLFKVQQIQKPLLIGQGGKDPRVKQQESDQIVQAMEEKRIPVTYVLFPNEGHGFDRPEHNIAFFAITEAFLGEHLGGRFEPIGYAFRDADFQVPVGAAGVPGLSEAIERSGGN